MSADLEERKIYDDNEPAWRTNLEEDVDAPSATDDDLPEGHPSRNKKVDSVSDLKQAEEKTGESKDSKSAMNYTGDDNNEKSSRLSRLRSSAAGLSSNRKALFIGAGTGGVFIVVIFALIMLSSLKVMHFGEVLSAAGYARLNGVFQERSTQIMFDNAATVGEGNISLRGRTIIDRVKFRNLDQQIAKLGQEGKVKFVLDDGNLQGIQLPESNKSITLDGITKDLGYGEKFTDISKGWSKLNPQDYRRVAAVRSEFVKQVKTGVNEGLATESRAVRGRVVKTIADNSGFKWSRWRNKAREYVGLKPTEAAVKNMVEGVEDTSPSKPLDTGIEQIDKAASDFKNGEKIKANIEKNGGTFDLAKFEADISADMIKGQKVQKAAGEIGIGVMIATVGCMANQAFSRVDEVAANNEKSAENMSFMQMSARDQQARGESVDEAIGAEAATLNGADQSPYYQYANGQPVTNPDSVDTPRIKPKYSGIADFISFISNPLNLAPGGSLLPEGFKEQSAEKFCGALLSPQGAATAAVAEVGVQAGFAFLTGGGSAAASQGAGRAALDIFITSLKDAGISTARGLVSKKAVGTLAALTAYDFGLQFVARQLSGADFAGTDVGASKFEKTAVGTSLLQSKRLRAVGGAPITNEEAAQVDQPYQKQKQAYWNSKGTFARYLAIENPKSLLGQVSAVLPSNSNSATSSVASMFSHIGSMLSGSMFKPILASMGLGNSASAATEYNPYFDIQQWGFSPDEMEKIRNDPSYSFFNNLDRISDAKITELDAKYSKCFDPATLQVEVEKLTECSKDELRKDDEMFRYRLTKLDDDIIKMLEQDPETIGQEEVAETAQPTNNKIYVVGDSLTVGMRDSGALSTKLSTVGWQPTQIQATVGDRVEDAVPKVDADKSNVAAAGTVVVMLGTNTSTDFPGKIKSMVEKIKSINSSATIYWMNAKTDKSDYGDINKAIQDQSTPLGYKVIDWASEYTTNKAAYPGGGDGIHLSAKGYNAKADYLVKILGPPAATAATNTSGIVGDIGNSSDSVPCAPGTKDLGVADSKYRGSKKLEQGVLKIRLCQIPEIPGKGEDPTGRALMGGAVLNSRVSGAWSALAKQAQSEGVGLSANSSFRLNDSCGGTGDGSSCARPGTSPHQLGAAIDFGSMSLKSGSTTSCGGRARLPSSKQWSWMFANAEKWGIEQYSYEAWHWDLLGGANRCNSSE